MPNPFHQPLHILGKTMGRLPTRAFGLQQPDRLFHTYIIGQTGTGKSTLLLNMMRQDVEAGRGFCLIDPHGDLADAIRPYIEESGVYWNPADADCRFGYNPLTYVRSEYRPLVASGIIDTLKQQWSDAWGVRMEHLLRNALLALLETPGSTLADIVPLFTQKVFRKQVIKYVTDVEVLRFWQDEYPHMNYKNAADGVAPIANKLGAFISNPNVRKALCNPEEPLRFRRLMDEGTPLVVNLSKGALGTDVSNVLGSLIVSMMAQAAYSRCHMREQRRRPYYLYADEFHSFTTEAFADMLSELRKYRLGLILAGQHICQLRSSVFEAILGNVGTLIVFRVGAKDASMMSKQLGRRPSYAEHINPAQIAALPNYQFFVRLMVGGRKSSVFKAKTLNSALDSPVP